MRSILPDAMLLSGVRRLAPGLPDSLAGRVRLIPARRPGRGDLSTDAARLCASAAGVTVARAAGWLADDLGGVPGVQQAWPADPGFVNLILTPEALREVPLLLACVSSGAAGPLVVPVSAMRRTDPGFMVQYTHARCCSVLRGAAGMAELGSLEPPLLAASLRRQPLAESSRPLLCRLDHWLRLTEMPDLGHNPQRIWLYLQDLSACFDQLWKRPCDDATLRLLHPGQPDRTRANLALLLGVARVIRAGLGMLGVQAAEEIR